VVVTDLSIPLRMKHDFSVRFVWHDHETQTYIEKVSETPRWIFNFIVEKYIES